MPPDNENGRPWQGGPMSSTAIDDEFSLSGLEHFSQRVILEALSNASRTWWLRRAEDFERARPVPGEYTGQASREDLRRRWRELTQIAQACRAKAALCVPEDATDDLAAVWRELVA